MDKNFETFLLFYTSFHEGELTLKEMRVMIVEEVGEAGLLDAVATLRQKRLEREAAGVKRTLHDIMQDKV